MALSTWSCSGQKQKRAARNCARPASSELAEVRRLATAGVLHHGPVLKSARLTEPILMYQHSRSGVFGVGGSQKLERPVCTLVLVAVDLNRRLNGQVAIFASGTGRSR